MFKMLKVLATAAVVGGSAYAAGWAIGSAIHDRISCPSAFIPTPATQRRTVTTHGRWC